MPADRVAQMERHYPDYPRPLPDMARLPLGVVPQDRDEQLRQVDAIEAVRLLVEQYGAARVIRWAEHVAALRGEAR